MLVNHEPRLAFLFDFSGVGWECPPASENQASSFSNPRGPRAMPTSSRVLLNLLTVFTLFNLHSTPQTPRRLALTTAESGAIIRVALVFRGHLVKTFRVLVVDDEERILNFLRSKLKASGYEVLTATDGVQALELAQTQEPDLMVLDLVMPRMDGFEALRQLRVFSPVPVIILTARGDDADKIKGLTLGADDYLQKPFNPDELVARIEAVRRRLGPELQRMTTAPLNLGDMTIYFNERKVVINREEVYLNRTEWLLLTEFARNPNRLMLHHELLTTVWGYAYRDDIQLLRTWISRLRHKLGSRATGPGLIQTVPKIGYMLQVPSAE